MHPRIGLLQALALAHLGVLAWAWSGLPAEVAIHFGRFGRPDGWVTRGGFAWLTAALALGAVLGPVLVRWLVGWLPPSLINVPRREYWFHEDREASARQLLGEWVLGVGALTAGLTLATIWLLARANLAEPVRMPNLFFLILAAYLLILLMAVTVLLFRMSRGQADDRPG